MGELTKKLVDFQKIENFILDPIRSNREFYEPNRPFEQDHEKPDQLGKYNIFRRIFRG